VVDLRDLEAAGANARAGGVRLREAGRVEAARGRVEGVLRGVLGEGGGR